MVFYYFFVQTTYRAILQAENFNWYLLFGVTTMCLEDVMKLTSSTSILLQTISVSDCERIGFATNLFDCATTIYTIGFYASLLFIRIRVLRKRYSSVVPAALQRYAGMVCWTIIALAVGVVESTGQDGKEQTFALLGHCNRSPRPYVRRSLAALLCLFTLSSLVLLFYSGCFVGLVLRGRMTWRRHWPMLVRFVATAMVGLIGDVTSFTIRDPPVEWLPYLSATAAFLTVLMPVLFLVTENLLAAAWGSCRDGLCPTTARPGLQLVEVQTITFYSSIATSRGPDSLLESVQDAKEAADHGDHDDDAAAAAVAAAGSGDSPQVRLMKRGFTMLFRTSLGLEYHGRPITEGD